MRFQRQPSIRLPIATAVVVAGLALSGCATKQFVREHVAEQIGIVNTRLAATDTRVADAIQRADAANAAAQGAATAAQAANTAAQTAGADARAGSQRLDQLTTRMDTFEQQRVTRGARN